MAGIQDLLRCGGAIMDAVTGGCSWGDAFAGQNNPKGPLHGTCTRP